VRPVVRLYASYDKKPAAYSPGRLPQSAGNTQPAVSVYTVPACRTAISLYNS